jgi:hypothetical protein
MAAAGTYFYFGGDKKTLDVEIRKQFPNLSEVGKVFQCY